MANSVFLTGGGSGSTTAPPPSPTPSPDAEPETDGLDQTATFSGSLSSKRSSKRFSLSVGTGDVANALSFTTSGGGGGGKGGKGGGGGGTTSLPSLQLRILATDGTVLASGTGPSVLQFASTLPAGTYTWEVSGTTSVSFSLAITYRTP